MTSLVHKTMPLHKDRWAALLARDPEADGRFVYGVVTTGIYCMPTCAAKRPLPENVRFFATAKEAEQAGFRACKRCKPSRAHQDPSLPALEHACALIEEAGDAPDFDGIAEKVGWSRSHFQRQFKAALGMTPGAYARAARERQVMAALGKASVTTAIYDAGYGSSSRFYETVAPKLGLKPKSFAKFGAGETIQFAVGACSLGAVLVAATEKGVCAIELGDDANALVEGLQDRFQEAQLQPGDAVFDTWVASVVGLIEEPRRALHLPLHVRGTAFQHKVWRALQAIPPGATVSYAELAALIGKPESVRAVANACGKNTLAVAIPCHRVVRTDGSLSGYRWGVERKAALIARESKGTEKG